jgi:serine phosphatase RsbU (regulator of sigma subunit)
MSAPRPAALLVESPSGVSSRLSLHTLPFRLGRAPENQLVLRDNRASRAHAVIRAEAGEYYIEDAGSRSGVYVNGKRVERQRLANGDRIEFGLTESYTLTFTLEEEVEIHRLLGQFQSSAPGSGNLARLRALVEVARTLQTSLSIDDVLSAVVDAALTVTGAERGFLLLSNGDDLDIRVARSRTGAPVPKSDLHVPTRLIRQALNRRRELLSMNFEPDAAHPDLSVADLDLRSVVCVPLVRVRTGKADTTQVVTTGDETVGVLYMDSRAGAADLSHGGRELLQTLALEASTVLENARLLEEEREKHKLEKELAVAREIQAGLLPRSLPATGWFRAVGSSQPSHLVGGDYYDILNMEDGSRVAVVADVSGKGVSSALLASLLQGAFLLASESPMPLDEMMRRVNHFLNERAAGEKYATIFYARFEPGGRLSWVNAGHCPPVLLRHGELSQLSATGVPVGLVAEAAYEVRQMTLEPGDKLVLYTDGVSEAMNEAGEMFGRPRLNQVLQLNAARPAAELHAVLTSAVTAFVAGAVQSDDITLVVLEYQPLAFPAPAVSS